MKRLLLPLLLAGLFAHCSNPTITTPSAAPHRISYDSVDMESSRATWMAKSAEAECYEMTVEEIAFLRGVPLRIRVEHGAIVEVAKLHRSPAPPSLVPPSQFNRYPTIDTLFDLAGSLGRQVKDSTANRPYGVYVISVRALYDTTWGFPSMVVRDYGNDREYCEDCWDGYKVIAFKPLDCP